jgi:GTP-binding protein
MFVDEVDITVRAGRGGDGCLAFLREKYRPLGGPAGGDGGRGGSVVFQAHPGLRTLADFRGRRILAAKNGQPGEGRNRNGKSASNLVIKVPVGTIIHDRTTGEIIGDLTKSRQKITVAKGGKGGRGNARFATSTNRAPRKFEKGEPGEERDLTLELRLLADVGLVGLPNAGKSTLIGAVSTVRPRVADYPFTTLMPSVGVVRLGDFASFTMADIPGLIELAHQGKGLGHQFLKHIRRTEIICHLVEIPLYSDSSDERFRKMVDAYKTIRGELKAYDEELALKREVVCWTKSDILPKDELKEFRDQYLERFIAETGCPEPVMIISAVTGDSISKLLGKLAELLDLDLKRSSEECQVPEYIDSEPPEQLPASELSMDRLEEESED